MYNSLFITFEWLYNAECEHSSRYETRKVKKYFRGGLKIYFLYEPTMLKGQSHEVFCIRFSHHSAPPGPDGDVQGPFRFILLFG